MYAPFVSRETIIQPEIFPIITIKEIEDNLREETLSKSEQKLNLIYEIEIFSMDRVTNGVKVSKMEITKELINLVNEVFENYFGFTRVSKRPMPNIDLDVDRFYLRYEGIYDTNTKKIFRR